MRQFGSILVILLLIGHSPMSQANKDNRVVAGWVEKITLAANADTLKAKLDTGAKTSSINAVDIERFKRGKEKWVRFKLRYSTAQGETGEQELERRVLRRIRVKEHEGENDSRVVVNLSFCFAGRWQQAQFSLVDRSKFVYPVLLGRRFLERTTLIDPAATFLTQPTCSEDSPT